MEFSLIDEGGISIWSGYKPHQHNLKWLAESEGVGIWKTKIRTLILVDCRSVLLSFVCKTIVNIYLAAVENIHGSCNNGTCLEDHEFSAFEASFYERNVDRGFWA